MGGEINYERVGELAEKSSLSTTDLKASVAALHFIVGSAAKYDLDDISMGLELQQLGLAKEKVAVVVQAFSQGKQLHRVATACCQSERAWYFFCVWHSLPILLTYFSYYF